MEKVSCAKEEEPSCSKNEKMENDSQINEEKEKVAAEIEDLIRNASECNFPRIMVCGTSNSEKSTLLHYLINKMLSQSHHCIFLNTDPGQPEFTPPGVVSLTQVKEPILGPGFFYQNMKSKMIFIGDVSPSFIDMFNKAVKKLMELYYNEYKNAALLINTVGWIEGTGLLSLINNIAIIKPTMIIEIGSNQGSTICENNCIHLPENIRFVKIQSNPDRNDSYTPKMMQDVSLVSYLGKCIPPHLGFIPINEIPPYCVSWKKIALFVFPDGKILPSRTVEALNGSFVALCRVPDTCILESNIPEFPKTLEPDPENECLGFGFVKAINERDSLLYIITPLKKQQLDRVNAIMKGNVIVPDSIILEQEIYNKELPFTNVVEMPVTNVDEGVTDEGLCTDEELMEIVRLSLEEYFSSDKSESESNVEQS